MLGQNKPLLGLSVLFLLFSATVSLPELAEASRKSKKNKKSLRSVSVNSVEDQFDDETGGKCIQYLNLWYSANLNRKGTKYSLARAKAANFKRRAKLARKNGDKETAKRLNKRAKQFRAKDADCIRIAAERPSPEPSAQPSSSPSPEPSPSLEPSPTPEPSTNPPVANNGSFSGQGIAPIAFSLSVDGNGEQGELSCEIIAAPAEISVQLYPNCTGLATPQDHRSSNVSFQYRARRVENSQPSNVAEVTLNWTQSSFSGDALSVATYKESLNREEAMHLIRSVNFGADAEELVNIAAGPNGLDNLVQAILQGSGDSNDCEKIHNEALAVAYAEREDEIYNYNGDDYICQSVYTRTLFNGNNQNFSLPFCAATPNPEDHVLWTHRSVMFYWLHMMRYGCHPAKERFGLLLHNHFPVDLTGYNRRSETDHFMIRHVDLLRGEHPDLSADNFPRLDTLTALTHGSDPSMLALLDNDDNAYPYGNENHAREFFELFVLGPLDLVTGFTNYTEDHVFEASYALMGYDFRRVSYSEANLPYMKAGEASSRYLCCNPDDYVGYTHRDGEFAGDPICPYDGDPSCGSECEQRRCREMQVSVPVFDQLRRDHPTRPRAEVMFAGQPWQSIQDYQANTLEGGIDTLTPYVFEQHPGVARYLAARLFVSFAGLELTQDILNPLAARLLGDSFDPEGVLREVFRSSSFFSEQTRYDSISSPIETMITFLRLLNIPLERVDSNNDLYQALLTVMGDSGQSLGAIPTVFGYDEAGKISGNQIYAGKTWLATQSWLNRMNSITRFLNELDDVIDHGSSQTSFEWMDLVGDGNERQPAAVLSANVQKLGITLSPSQEALILEYLNAIRTSSEDVQIDWQGISEADLERIWQIKIPGLLEILFNLSKNNTR